MFKLFLNHLMVDWMKFNNTLSNALVFQIHGPDVAIKQARGVRHQVVPRALPLFAFFIGGEK